MDESYVTLSALRLAMSMTRETVTFEVNHAMEKGSCLVSFEASHVTDKRETVSFVVNHVMDKS